MSIGILSPSVAIALPAKSTSINVSTVNKTYSENQYISSDINVLLYYNYQQQLQQQKQQKQQNQQKQQQQTKQQQKQKTQNHNSQPVNKTVNDNTLRLSISSDSENTMVNKINRFFEGTPMSGHGSDFVNAGIKYNVDPYFIAAITMQESSGGLYVGAQCNAWGRKALGGGWMSFPSWTAGIFNETKYIADNYLDEGLNSINSISYKYCPSPREQWVSGVTGFQQQIANE